MNESLRQVVHLLFGLGIAAFILLFDRDLSLSVLMLALFVGFILSDAVSRGYTIPVVSAVIANLERRDAAPGRGALFFALGALFCLVFFPKEIAFIGLVVLSLLDSVTTLAGVRFGRTRIYNHKSLEGTLAGVAVTAVAELVIPVDDNLVIPVVACLALTVLL